MKIITYQNKKTFKLTDVEFKKANESWSRKANYWCSRIEAMMTPMFLYAETPRDEIGKEIYFGADGSRVCKKQNKFFRLGDDGNLWEVEHHNKEMQEKFEKNLILQEDFYNKSNLKTIDSKINNLIKK